jgi:hypothetical protein
VWVYEQFQKGGIKNVTHEIITDQREKSRDLKLVYKKKNRKKQYCQQMFLITNFKICRVLV